MNGVCTGFSCDGNNLVLSKVAFRCRSRANKIRFIYRMGMQRVAIRFGIHPDGLNAHFTARARDTHGDFSAIGDE